MIGVMDLYGHSDSTELLWGEPPPSCTSSGPEATGLGAASSGHRPYQTRSNSLSAILTRSPVCRLRSFSTVLANASALAATACCLRRLVRLAEAQESWSTGGEAGPEEDRVTDYE